MLLVEPVTWLRYSFAFNGPATWLGDGFAVSRIIWVDDWLGKGFWFW